MHKFFLFIFFSFFLTLSKSQSIITPSDTIKSAKNKKVQSFKSDTTHSPKIAGLLSACIPGLGQAYNQKYWKIPIIYGIGTYLISNIVLNTQKYNDFNASYQILLKSDSLRSLMEKETLSNFVTQYGVDTQQGANNLRILRDEFQRLRDLTIIFTVVTYVLNIVDASVDAHFYNFDVSENLSMKIKPTLFAYGSPNLGLSIDFNLKK